MSEQRGQREAQAVTAGTIIAGRYRVQRELGRGGMGVVVEAIDTQLGRAVALKLLKEAEPAAVARLEREARAAARLDHPNIVAVTEFFVDATFGPVIVMERLRGETLHDHIVSRSAMSEAAATEVAIQALSALEAAHALGIVHRDIKPSNVFLVPHATGGWIVKLVDFGIVKLLDHHTIRKLTRDGAAIGTPAYMSPEQALGDPLDGRSDLYALAATIYEALAGVPAYDGDDPMTVVGRILSEPPDDIRRYRPTLHPLLVDALARAMARRREDRWSGAAALRTHLVSLLPSLSRGADTPAASDAPFPQETHVAALDPRERATSPTAFAKTLPASVLTAAPPPRSPRVRGPNGAAIDGTPSAPTRARATSGRAWIVGALFVFVGLASFALAWALRRQPSSEPSPIVASPIGAPSPTTSPTTSPTPVTHTPATTPIAPSPATLTAPTEPSPAAPATAERPSERATPEAVGRAPRARGARSHAAATAGAPTSAPVTDELLDPYGE